MTNAIEAQGLTKRFGDTQALAGVHLAAREGTVLGVLGPYGAGRTTAVRVPATLLQPDAPVAPRAPPPSRTRWLRRAPGTPTGSAGAGRSDRSSSSA
jgi:ATPase subunit of ABC transporter with duplicated ATPase domains